MIFEKLWRTDVMLLRFCRMSVGLLPLALILHSPDLWGADPAPTPGVTMGFSRVSLTVKDANGHRKEKKQRVRAKRMKVKEALATQEKGNSKDTSRSAK